MTSSRPGMKRRTPSGFDVRNSADSDAVGDAEERLALVGVSQVSDAIVVTGAPARVPRHDHGTGA